MLPSPSPRSITRPTAIRSIVVTSRAEGADGKGKEAQQVVRLGPSRGDQVAVLSGLKEGDEVVTSGVFKLRATRSGEGEQQRAAGQRSQPETRRLDKPSRPQNMKFTDLFIRRPVVATVLSLIILMAGLQSIHRLNVRQYPRSDIATSASDDLRRRERGPGAGLHHHAARTGHRQRRRHRLHRVAERAGAQHHHGAPQAELRHQRRADADPVEARAGAQRSAARGGGAGHRIADERQPVRHHVYELRLEGSSTRARSPITSRAWCSRS